MKSLSRTRGRRGNAIAEVALMMIPLFGLLFGIIDFGFALFLRSTLQHAVREGTRYGVTYQIVAGMCQDASIKEVVKNSAMGFLTGRDSMIKVRYFDPVTFTEIATPNANSAGNVIEVAVEGYDHHYMAPLYWSSQALTINVRSSDRMEGMPANGAPCR